jgi:hypothetical protein
MDLLLTSSTVQQSTPVLNKRDDLKTETVDVLSGVVEARNVRGSSPIRCVPRVILVFITQVNKCCVYQALAPEF